MNYWAVPGIKKTIVFAAFYFKAKKKLRDFVSINPNSGVVHFYQGASALMGVQPKSKINFLIFGHDLFFYKSNNGVSIRVGAKTNLRTQSRPLGKFIKEAMSLRNLNTAYSFKCKIKKTMHEFGGEQLFQVEPPIRIKSAIKGLSNKQ